MPYFLSRLVPPPSAHLPPRTMAGPPMSKFASSKMTDAPFSAASIAAGRPAAPAPTTTMSACLSQCGGRPCASASAAKPPSAAAPTPAPVVFTKSRRDNLFLSLSISWGSRAMPDLPIVLMLAFLGLIERYRLRRLAHPESEFHFPEPEFSPPVRSCQRNGGYTFHYIRCTLLLLHSGLRRAPF